MRRRTSDGAAEVSDSEAHLSERAAPEHLDEHGLLRADKILEWMDVVGVLAAARHCRNPVVTASIDALDLREPIRLGDRVAMTARVAYTSEHGVGVSVSTTHGGGGDRASRPPVEAYMTFVPQDRRGRPATVPSFAPRTPAECARFRESERRSELLRLLAEEGARLRSDGRPPPGLSESDWLVVLREWTSRFPRQARLSWERAEAQLECARASSYIHEIHPVPMGALNLRGTLDSGTVMRWSEESSRSSARGHVDGAPVRCTGLHGLSFLRPVTAGQFVHVRSLVVHTSGSSITSLVSVHSEDPAERIYVENLRALFTYAPLESWVPVAAVKCHSIEERALHDEVEGRIALQRWLAAAVRGPDA